MNYGPNLDSKVNLSVATLLHSTSLAKMPCDRDHILLAALPKSGSTWLEEILAALPGQTKVQLVPGWQYREQELAFERLIAFHAMNYICRLHIMFSDTTAAYCNTFSIKPIVSIRNFFDCVPSVRDWFDTGSEDTPLQGPVSHIPKEYYRLSDEEKFDYIIDMMMPWYFKFFIGWQECSNCVWVRYEDLVTDPASTLADVFDKIGLGLSRPIIEGALERAARIPTKKNLAKIGRGAALLTAEQKNRIKKFASYYPSVDFSPVGL
jgi:hypothetical protein